MGLPGILGTIIPTAVYSATTKAEPSGEASRPTPPAEGNGGKSVPGFLLQAVMSPQTINAVQSALTRGYVINLLLEERSQVDQMVTGKQKKVPSHGCIHFGSGDIEKMTDLGAGVGTRVIAKRSSERYPQDSLPPPLPANTGERFNSRDLVITVFPNQELAILSTADGKDLYSMRIQGGPQYKRMNSDGNLAIPTPADTYMIISTDPKSRSSYTKSNLPGGVEIVEIDYENRRVQYIDKNGEKKWLLPTNSKKGKLIDSFSDNEFTERYLESRIILENGEYTNKTYYVGHDFGNGFPTNTEDSVGGLGVQIVFGLLRKRGNKQWEGTGIFGHSDGFEEYQRRETIQCLVNNLLSNEPISPTADYLGENTEKIHPLLVKVAGHWEFDKETKTLDYSCLTTQERTDLETFLAEQDIDLSTSEGREEFENMVIDAYNRQAVAEYLETPGFKKLKITLQAYFKSQIDQGRYADFEATAEFLLSTVLEGYDTKEEVAKLFDTILAVTEAPVEATVAQHMPVDVDAAQETTLSDGSNLWYLRNPDGTLQLEVNLRITGLKDRNEVYNAYVKALQETERETGATFKTLERGEFNKEYAYFTPGQKDPLDVYPYTIEN